MKKISSSEIIIGCVAGGITFLLFGLIASIFSKPLGIFLYIVAAFFFIFAIAKKIDNMRKKEEKKALVTFSLILWAIVILFSIIIVAGSTVSKNTKTTHSGEFALVSSSAESNNVTFEMESDSREESKSTTESRKESKADVAAAPETFSFALNESTKKFHRLGCGDVEKIAPENYNEISVVADSLRDAIQQVEAMGYSACGHCM